METRRVPWDEMTDTFRQILENSGLDRRRSEETAVIFAGNTADGVASHGAHRFGRFVQHLRSGIIRFDGRLEKISDGGPLERWDGGGGIGPLNARDCTDRALALADRYGVGIVALRNTTHWMRPGAYGFRAAEKGYPFICWTNTMPNMPPWGSRQPKVGNNPIVLAVPRSNGPVVLDMALSQFSYGRLDAEAREGRRLPVPGGYDEDNRLTDDPAAVLASGRALPVGYWKGSGLSLLLDLLASILSGGAATKDISADEKNLSQVYTAFSPAQLGGIAAVETVVENVISDFRDSSGRGEADVRYPGEGALRRRAESRKRGIPVNATVWDDILALLPDRSPL